MKALIAWSAIVVLTVAAFSSASLGLVDVVAFIATLTFLTACTIALLWTRSASETHLPEEADHA